MVKISDTMLEPKMMSLCHQPVRNHASQVHGSVQSDCVVLLACHVDFPKIDNGRGTSQFLRNSAGIRLIFKQFWINFESIAFLACLFRRKSRAIVITRLLSSSLLSSGLCKNFNVANYSKSKVINTKCGILAHHDKMQWHDKGHNSESYILVLWPFQTWIFK